MAMNAQDLLVLMEKEIGNGREKRRDAELILAHVLGGLRPPIFWADIVYVTTEQIERAKKLSSARANGTPIAHITGIKSFWKHEFIVSEHVLIPRPETELLIETALKIGPFESVLDMGTGSGAILLSLLFEMEDAIGVGVDISQDAINIARKNANKLAVHERSNFIKSDWFSQVNGSFDLIISNPPYIALHEMNDLMRDVRDYEPQIALSDGGNGLGCYEYILRNAKKHLNDKGKIILEHGYSQRRALLDLAVEYNYKILDVFDDLNGVDRCILLE